MGSRSGASSLISLFVSSVSLKQNKVLEQQFVLFTAKALHVPNCWKTFNFDSEYGMDIYSIIYPVKMISKDRRHPQSGR